MSNEKETRGIVVGVVIGFALAILLAAGLAAYFLGGFFSGFGIGGLGTGGAYGGTPPPNSEQSMEIKARQVVRLEDASGVSLVELTPEPNESASYRWRHVAAGQTNETTGSGRVFEKYDRRRSLSGGYVLTDLGSVLHIRAGPILVKWSHGSEHGGYIYFEPVRVKARILFNQTFDTAPLTSQ